MIKYLKYRVKGKPYVFHNPMQTIPLLHIVTGGLLSLTRSGYAVTLISVLFSLPATIIAQCWRQDCKILKILFFPEHPVAHIVTSLSLIWQGYKGKKGQKYCGL